MKKLAPIVLFVYSRLKHTCQTVSALQKNYLADQSTLIIYSDGPKPGKETQVAAVRQYIKTIKGFKSVNIVESKNNKGLANSIIEGVSAVVNKYGRVIVLEDDLVTSKYFLKYMNEALDFYQDKNEVISIHGYIYPVKKKLPETFFLKGADCWGWATWKRGWALFESNGKKLLSELEKRGLTKEFDFNGSYAFTNMLREQIAGKNDSWAIRWYASAFLKNKLTLYPGQTLVKNIGFDQSGEHCGDSQKWFNNDLLKISINKFTKILEEDVESKNLIVSYFKFGKNQAGNKRIKLKTLLKKMADLIKLL